MDLGVAEGQRGHELVSRMELTVESKMELQQPCARSSLLPFHYVDVIIFNGIRSRSVSIIFFPPGKLPDAVNFWLGEASAVTSSKT